MPWSISLGTNRTGILALRFSANRSNSTEGLPQFVKIDRLGKVKVEPGLQTGLAFFCAIPSGQGDGFQWLLLFGFLHQIKPVAVRQTKVTDQDVDLHFIQQRPGFTCIFRRHRLIATSAEQKAQNPQGITVILHDQRTHGFEKVFTSCE